MPHNQTRVDTAPARFWAKVDKHGPVPEHAPRLGRCWIWNGAADEYGYGNLSVGAATRKAHRLSYEWAKGTIPAGFEIDHLCRVPACVNPAHLEAVTPKINSRRSFSVSGLNHRKTHCNHGHPFSGDNLRIDPRGHRRCRE